MAPWDGTTSHRSDGTPTALVAQGGPSFSSRVPLIASNGPKQSPKSGLEHLTDPSLNRGGAFTNPERELLGLRGLLPPAVSTLKGQEARLMAMVRRAATPLEKHGILSAVRRENHAVFYRALLSHPQELFPIVGTPTIGAVCQAHGDTTLSLSAPQGLYITSSDRGAVPRVIANWPASNVKMVVITDGENVLGDLGAHGLPLAVSQCSLYTACGGIHPSECLAIAIDVGTDNEKLRMDDGYLGLRQARVRGAGYTDLLDEVMGSIAGRWPSSIVQFEAFSNKHAFEHLEKYRNNFCTFNDDIQGSAAVVLAALMSALRVTDRQFSDQTILLYGAGNTGCGVGDLIVAQMVHEGLTEADARARIWMADSQGLVLKTRSDLAPQKRVHAQAEAPKALAQMQSLAAPLPEESLLEMVEALKPTCLIGASSQQGAFSSSVLQKMAEMNPRPIIFALSTPTELAECTPEQAFLHTGGNVLFCSGGATSSITSRMGTLRPAQATNAYVFPGVALGLISSGATRVTTEVFRIAARVLAQMVSDSDLDQGSLLPPLSEIRQVAARIGTQVAEHVFQSGLTQRVKPSDVASATERMMYKPGYPQMFKTPVVGKE